MLASKFLVDFRKFTLSDISQNIHGKLFNQTDKSTRRQKRAHDTATMATIITASAAAGDDGCSTALSRCRGRRSAGVAGCYRRENKFPTEL